MAEQFDVNAPTLGRFVMSNTRDTELVILMNAIATSCKLITSAVNRAGVAQLYGLAGEVNSTGDDQKKLDVMSNDMMINALVNSGVCSVLVSEENEEPIIVPKALQGKYCVAFDPLDGSSNIDCNVSVGTIFSVYEATGDGNVEDLLRSGAHCVCAGYCVYSSAVELVFTFRGGSVHGFCLDPTIGEFVHTRPKMMMPADGGKRIYSCNEGNAVHWDQPIKDAVDAFKNSVGGKPYTARYVGSMVADIHRTLLYGGIYLYPADAKSPKGKLRCLYEGIPMAMIIEQAGGIASTGMFEGKIQRVLELTPDDIHCKCPIIMGGPRDVQVVYDEYKKAGIETPPL
eukprot:CAMPEP_0195519296 /NCGR_PEP_ID=MMETSP0794_2-20130614/14562_1 /TAXON_ID=515487 /ORGANISM="Stephanopyxis turris, Strain CCMP 815" /LENGTH=341 /DNA_ID=CAMNT_0040648421 /DNA_START=50 /DNA_END=1075 /DNA_ORIENTATION=-